MDLSIICVNWNSVDYLVECIDSIHANTSGLSFEVIVVDNASPQGRLDILRDAFPAAKIIESKHNLGFAGANNLGFRNSSGDCILFLNPDTRLVGPAITLMLEKMSELDDAGIVGCTLLDGDLSISTTSIQKFPTILNQVADIEYFRVHWPKFPLWDISPLFCVAATPQKVDVISGACMLVRRNVFERAGMFSEEYFMYAEDIDLNYKVFALGLQNYYVGEARIVHYGGKSSSQQVTQWATVMKYRAMVRLLSKIRGPLYAATYRVAILLCAVARLFILILTRWVTCRDVFGPALKKWNAVLKWALGIYHSMPSNPGRV